MTQAKTTLVVDTNVLSRAINPKQTDSYKPLFEELERQYIFTVSGFTRFELMRSSDKAHRNAVANYISQEMVSVDLSRVLMDFSARVYYLYSKHPVTKGKNITEGDIINAALAIIKGCPVLTHDGSDYPAPFFRELIRRPITLKSAKNKDVIEMVYLLEPDMEHIKYCFGEHEI